MSSSPEQFLEERLRFAKISNGQKRYAECYGMNTTGLSSEEKEFYTNHVNAIMCVDVALSELKDSLREFVAGRFQLRHPVGLKMVDLQIAMDALVRLNIGDV